jgi:hypothetical protein
VVENQKKRSSGPTSFCRARAFACSSRIPPWPCTIGFGSPVVPEEYRTYSGWAKGTASCTRGADAAVSSAHVVVPSMRASASRYGSTTVAARPGSAARISSTSRRRSIALVP